jgi:hypothetical protein
LLIRSSLVPADVEHLLVWSRAPFIHPAIIHPSISQRIEQDGLSGFIGLESPPPSPSTLPAAITAVESWGITLDNVIISPKGTDEEEAYVKKAGEEVHKYVESIWKAEEWEVAWFVNPPVGLRLELFQVCLKF